MKHPVAMIEQEVVESLPWYRYGMVWMIILLPLTVVVASMLTIKIAFDNAPVVVGGNEPMADEKPILNKQSKPPTDSD